MVRPADAGDWAAVNKARYFGYFDIDAHSSASFDLVRGIHRLLAIAQELGIRASLMIDGVICECDRRPCASWRAGPTDHQNR